MSDTALRKLSDVTCDLLETMIHVAQSKRTLVISFHNVFVSPIRYYQRYR